MQALQSIPRRGLRERLRSMAERHPVGATSMQRQVSDLCHDSAKDERPVCRETLRAHDHALVNAISNMRIACVYAHAGAPKSPLSCVACTPHASSVDKLRRPSLWAHTAFMQVASTVSMAPFTQVLQVPLFQFSYLLQWENVGRTGGGVVLFFALLLLALLRLLLLHWFQVLLCYR